AGHARVASGVVAAFVVVIGLSMATVSGTYQTGSPGDIGWMLPFWFAAWAMADAPPSVRDVPRPISAPPIERSSPAVLFAAILAVPIVGYSARYLVPASAQVDRLREMATA